MHHLHRDSSDMKFNLYDDDDEYWNSPTISNTSSSYSAITTTTSLAPLSINLPFKHVIPTNPTNNSTTSANTVLSPTAPATPNNDSNGINSPPTMGRTSMNWGSITPPASQRPQIDSKALTLDNDGCSTMDVDRDKRIGDGVLTQDQNDSRADKDKTPQASNSTQKLQSMLSTTPQPTQVTAPKRMTKRLRLESLQAYMTPEQKEEQKKKLKSTFEEMHERVKVKKRAPRKDFWHQVKPEDVMHP
jgi:hypothetical protein